MISALPRILLIDGNHEERDYYAKRLRTSSTDYAVILAATGRFGLLICKNPTIDSVVLEFELPDMSGFEILVRLVPRVYHPEIAEIILTRLNNPHLLDAAIKNGAQTALQKSRVSGDILDKAIIEAITRVHRDRKRHHDS